ncbi:MAG: GNAT family N-acetyltransferase [Rhodobacteraceae bacterium]|nr:GNAT family N-acetyltransferase [Paracoccaceae bacterium]
MPLERRPVTRDHLKALFKLKVSNAQQMFVAPNEVTLAQQAYEPGGYVWGLWRDDTPVGLIAMVHPHEYADPEPGDDHDAAYIWRLMIGAAHQGRGYGKAALVEAEVQARAWGLPRLNLSFVEAPGSAEPFYTKYGFTRTGRVVSGEVEMSLEIASK